MARGTVKRNTIFKRLFSIFHGEGKDIFVILVYAAVVGLCSLALPIAVQALVSSVASASILQPIVVLTFFVGAVLAFAGIVRLFQFWATETLQRRLMVRCSLAMAQRLSQVNVREFSKYYGSNYVVRFMELFNVQKMTALLLLEGSAVFFQIIVGLTLVSFYHPFFLALALTLLVLVIFVVVILGIGGIDSSIAESEAKYEVVSWLQTIASIPETFKCTSGQELAYRKMDSLISNYLDQRSSHFRILMRQNIGAILLQTLSSALLLGLGGWLVIKGQLTLGQLVAAELVFSLVLAGVVKLGRHLEKLYDLSASISKLDSLFDLPYETQAGTFFGITDKGAELEATDMTIQSEDFKDPILSKVSFKIASNQKAVLWGPNGSGKSVLTDILYQTVQSYSGRIEIDGHPLKSVHPKELRQEVAVTRGLELFDGTIEENLSLGNKTIHQAEIMRVLNLVGLSDKIFSLEHGLNSVVPSAKTVLSSGESLRLMIARAIISRPRLLIIDGTLDSMDDASQERMIELIKNGLPDITVLLMTHELKLAQALPLAFEIKESQVKLIGAKRT